MSSSVFLYSGDTLLLETNLLAGITLSLADGDYLLLKAGGVASQITVSRDCLMELENGARADSIRLLSEGTCLVNAEASLDFLVIDNGGLCNLHGDLETADVSGALFLYSNASLCTAIVNAGGLLSLWGNTCTANDIIVCGTASVYHGTISNAYTMDSGRVRLGSDATANDITICEGGSIDISTGATITNLTALANAFVRVAPGANLTGTICLTVPLSISGEVNATSADFILLPEGLTDLETPMISDWRLCPPHSISISISEKLQPGTYKIAANIDVPITIQIINQSGAELEKCSPAKRLSCDDFILSLEMIDSTLSFCAEYCTYTQINSNLTLRTDDNGLAIFGCDKNNLETRSWNKNTNNLDNTITILSTDTSEWNASALEIPAIFFANPSAIWGRDYLALNVNTHEFRSMAGKNRFDGVFIGSCVPSLLMLTQQDDAIFADDIFTPFPDSTEKQNRLTMLAEIRADDGDDLIDMTNEHFLDANEGISLRGGNGNDVIWGANDGSCLFGDLGNDQLTGGSGNDILCGGGGNDILRGAGGFDIYAFGFDAGNDIIILDDGEFILWFEEGIVVSENDISIESNTAVISFGMFSSVTINNLIDDKLEDRLVFGDSGSFANMSYTSLANIGAFDSDSSTRIFNAIA